MDEAHPCTAHVRPIGVLVHHSSSSVRALNAGLLAFIQNENGHQDDVTDTYRCLPHFENIRNLCIILCLADLLQQKQIQNTLQ